MPFAIVAAGGLGTRVGYSAPKYELPLHGKPMLIYSLEAFQDAPSIAGIVLVIHSESGERWGEAALREAGITKVISVIEGGSTRRESVRKGLEELAGEGEDEVVVVHDAARPLLTVSLVEEVCVVPDGFDGTIAAVPVTDTIKTVDGETITGTLDRHRLAAAQTPQAFRLGALRKAHDSARRSGFEGTDDAALVSRVDGRVRTVEGLVENIKVTWPGDIELAAFLLGEHRGVQPAGGAEEGGQKGLS